MSDDDPMAYLNAKRQEMAAMAEMAAVAEVCFGVEFIHPVLF